MLYSPAGGDVLWCIHCDVLCDVHTPCVLHSPAGGDVLCVGLLRVHATTGPEIGQLQQVVLHPTKRKRPEQLRMLNEKKVFHLHQLFPKSTMDSHREVKTLHSPVIRQAAYATPRIVGLRSALFGYGGPIHTLTCVRLQTTHLGEPGPNKDWFWS